MRRLPTAMVMAAVAFATVSWCAHAEAQRHPGLAVVRDYDGAGGSAATPISASPLPIVRSYEEGEPPHEPAALPALAPWEGTVARPRATLAIVTVFDGDDVAPTAHYAPLMLLNYEGAEMVRTVRDPAVHLLAMITDFDGATPTITRAHVYIAYDEDGGIVRVETALPPMNVNTSAAPDGPMVTMGGAITSTRTAVHRQGPHVRRAVRPASTLNPTR